MIRKADRDERVVIKIPWDSNTVRGFITAIVLTGVIILVSPYFDFKRPDPIPVSESIPIDVIQQLRIGSGGADKHSHGNMQEEGASAKSKVKAAHYEDASAARSDRSSKAAKSHARNELSTKLIPVKAVESERNKKKSLADENTTREKNNISDHSSLITKGEPGGSEIGTGKGVVGKGSGKGQGYELEWGGAGETTVVSKSLPHAPSGLSASTVVKLKFIINKNGDVEFILPLTRGIPIAENAARQAFRQWKFKPPAGGQRLEGSIKFRFDVN